MASYTVPCYTQISLLQGKRCYGTLVRWAKAYSSQLPPLISCHTHQLKWVIPHKGVYCHRHRSVALASDAPQYHEFVLSFLHSLVPNLTIKPKRFIESIPSNHHSQYPVSQQVDNPHTLSY